MEIPTYEEFYDKVKENFVWGWPSLSEEEVDKYLQSDMGQNVINERYEQGVRDLKNGKATYEQMIIGIAASASCCLELMYTPNL